MKLVGLVYFVVVPMWDYHILQCWQLISPVTTEKKDSIKFHCHTTSLNSIKPHRVLLLTSLVVPHHSLQLVFSAWFEPCTQTVVVPLIHYTKCYKVDTIFFSLFSYITCSSAFTLTRTFTTISSMYALQWTNLFSYLFITIFTSVDCLIATVEPCLVSFRTGSGLTHCHIYL